jgi:alkyl sulfatase BDS1-like metallo-beta-lactamase superfamily hydrolase
MRELKKQAERVPKELILPQNLFRKYYLGSARFSAIITDYADYYKRNPADLWEVPKVQEGVGGLPLQPSTCSA